jgi:hypothetical protein
MAAFELAYVCIGLFPVGFFGFNACGRIDEDGAVKHRGHKSSRGHYRGNSGGVRRGWRSSLRSSARMGERKRAQECDEKSVASSLAKVHEKLQKRDRSHWKQGYLFTADGLRDWESGNRWFEAGRRCCAGERRGGQHCHVVVQLTQHRDYIFICECRRLADLANDACAAMVLFRILAAYDVHALNFGMVRAMNAALVSRCYDHLSRHHVTCPTAQGQQGNHEG